MVLIRGAATRVFAGSSETSSLHLRAHKGRVKGDHDSPVRGWQNPRPHLLSPTSVPTLLLFISLKKKGGCLDCSKVISKESLYLKKFSNHAP